MTEDVKATKSVAYRSEYSDRLREDGFLEGYEEGRLREARRILIELLELVTGGIAAEHRKRIEASTDRRALDDWIKVIIRLRSQILSARE